MAPRARVVTVAGHPDPAAAPRGVTARATGPCNGHHHRYYYYSTLWVG
ncbi:hypothetical protein ACWC9H_27700 [Streptomyces sp. NPDC001251]